MDGWMQRPKNQKMVDPLRLIHCSIDISMKDKLMD